MKRADPRFQMRIKKEKDFYTFSFFCALLGFKPFSFLFCYSRFNGFKTLIPEFIGFLFFIVF